MPMMEKEGYGKKKGSLPYDQKEEEKELWHLNFLPLLED